MYSFAPLTSAAMSPVPGILLCAFIFLLVAYFSMFWDSIEWEKVIPYSVAGACLIWVLHHNLPPTIPVNTKLTGTFVEFIAQREISTHKNTQSVKEKMFVVYDINGSRVVLDAHSAFSYPKTAIIYFNAKD